MRIQLCFKTVILILYLDKAARNQELGTYLLLCIKKSRQRSLGQAYSMFGIFFYFGIQTSTKQKYNNIYHKTCHFLASPKKSFFSVYITYAFKAAYQSFSADELHMARHKPTTAGRKQKITWNSGKKKR